MVDYREQAGLLDLRAQLYNAWLSYRQGSAAAVKLRDEVLPALTRALDETQQAYERGRYSYRDWIAAQRDLLDARLAAIDAASSALLHQAPLGVDAAQAQLLLGALLSVALLW